MGAERPVTEGNGGHRRDIVVIGGSAGALEPLKRIVEDLPTDLPAAVATVLHLSANAPSSLAPILNRVGGLQAVNPQDGDPFRAGYIYVANPDLHLEVTRRGLRQSHGPRINGVRPSVDVLFESAAEAYGSRVVGVVLSGGLDDGSAGLAAIREAGGIGIVQDPDDAGIVSMPKNAIQRAAPEYVLDADAIGPRIAKLVGEVVEVPARNRARPKSQMSQPVGVDGADGDVTGLTCPDCHGTIWLKRDAAELTFECRVGHKYSPETFFDIQAGNVENAMWAAVRSLEEQATLAAAMVTRSERNGDAAAGERFAAREEQARFNARTLRGLLAGRD